MNKVVIVQRPLCSVIERCEYAELKARGKIPAHIILSTTLYVVCVTNYTTSVKGNGVI